jgi:hypothetical protein
VQDRIDAVLRQRFALPQVDPAFVKEMDVRMLVTESRDIRGGWHPDEKYQPPTWQPLDERIVAWSATKSEEQFMLAFVDLQQQMRPGPAIPYMPIHFDVEGKK